MEDGKSKDKSNIKMIQELWNTQMTVPELCFEADRTNNMVKSLLVAIILFYFFSLSLFFSFCLVWFVFISLSWSVWAENACTGCNKVCFSPSQWWFYDRKGSQRDSAALYYRFITSCSSPRMQLWSWQFMATLLTVKVNFYTFVQRLSVFTSVLIPLLCCKIHACS